MLDVHEKQEMETIGVDALIDTLKDEDSSYVETVVALAEQSERSYHAAMTAGTVVNGFSNSANF